MLPLTEAEESKELDELEQCTEVNKITFNRDKYEVLSSSPHCRRLVRYGDNCGILAFAPRKEQAAGVWEP